MAERHQSTEYYFSLLSGSQITGTAFRFDKVVERKFLSLAESLGDTKKTTEHKDSTSVKESRKRKELSMSVSTKGISANASFVKLQDQLTVMNGIIEERISKKITPVTKSGLNNVVSGHIVPNVRKALWKNPNGRIGSACSRLIVFSLFSLSFRKDV